MSRRAHRRAPLQPKGERALSVCQRVNPSGGGAPLRLQTSGHAKHQGRARASPRAVQGAARRNQLPPLPSASPLPLLLLCGARPPRATEPPPPAAGPRCCRRSALAGDVVAEPVQALVQPLARRRARALDVPVRTAPTVARRGHRRSPVVSRSTGVRDMHSVWAVRAMAALRQTINLLRRCRINTNILHARRGGCACLSHRRRRCKSARGQHGTSAPHVLSSVWTATAWLRSSTHQ
jgi:hypothetical protein